VLIEVGDHTQENTKKATNEMERCSGEIQQDLGKECISRYGIELRKMERITCGSSGSIWTMKLRKKKML